MNWTEIVTLSLASSILGSGLVMAIARRWLLGSIDRRLSRADLDMRFEVEQNHEQLRERILTYPMLMEFAYRAKLIAKECLEVEGSALPSHKVDQFGQTVNQITELLVGKRLLVPLPLFDQVHDTKRVCQNLLIHLDTLARTDLGDDPSIRQLAKMGALRSAKALEVKVEELDASLRTAMDEARKS